MNELIPVKYLYLLADFLKNDYKFDLTELCAKEGLILPKDAAELVSSEDFSKACEIGINQVNDPLLGLKFGNTLTFTHFGPLGAAMMSSKTIMDILELVTQFADTSFPFKIEINSEKENISIKPKYSHHFDPTIIFHSLTCIAGSIRFFEEAAGFVPTDIIIDLPFNKPEEAQKFRRYLPGQLRFNQKSFATHVPRNYLEQPLPRYDEVSRNVFLEMCENLQNRLKQEKSLASHISEMLDAYPIYPSIEQLSRVLAISPRTLRSRLQKEETNFREIVNKHRLNRAKELLSNSTQTIEQIAETIGYSDTPSFYRAFKKETDKTPIDYRQQKKN